VRPRLRASGHLKYGEARGDRDQCAAIGATQWFREEFGRVGRRWELAGARARGGGGNGGRRMAFSRRRATGASTYSRHVSREVA
jgi:hypothetical protein